MIAGVWVSRVSEARRLVHKLHPERLPHFLAGGDKAGFGHIEALLSDGILEVEPGHFDGLRRTARDLHFVGSGRNNMQLPHCQMVWPCGSSMPKSNNCEVGHSPLQMLLSCPSSSRYGQRTDSFRGNFFNSGGYFGDGAGILLIQSVSSGNPKSRRISSGISSLSR